MKESIKHIVEITAGITLFLLLVALLLQTNSETNFFTQKLILPLSIIFILNLFILVLINTKIIQKIKKWVNE